MSLWSVMVVLPLLFISIHAHPHLRSDEEISWLYKEWQVKFDKAYENPLEREKRYEIFKDNLLFIDQHNDPRNNYTYTLGLNSLADLSYQEYQSRYLFPIEEEDEEHIEQEEHKVDLEQLPQAVDWRLHGSVSAVINQETCGSCWAWAAAGAVEGFHHIQTGEMIRVSAQQLVDCVERCGGCNGGRPDVAFDYIIKEGGVDSLHNYPYTAEDGVCKSNASILVSINGWRLIPRKDGDAALQEAISRQPVSICEDLSAREFYLYDRGIFSGLCLKKKTNHAMLAVGYGSEDGQDYWIVKNSWGFNWGEDGYIRFERNVDEEKCTLMRRAAYAY